MFHNAGHVYSAFSTIAYTPGAPSPAGGTFNEPGGTVYDPGQSWVYYPQGDDWGTARRAHFVSLDAHAEVYGRYLHARGWAAHKALYWHEAGQRALVASSGTDDGRTPRRTSRPRGSRCTSGRSGSRGSTTARWRSRRPPPRRRRLPRGALPPAWHPDAPSVPLDEAFPDQTVDAEPGGHRYF
jgi:hypothetical protein